jgi:outer membrane receptor for Fe3+-dicitrate
MGKDLNWEFNARWNFGTGFPFTQTQGFYGKIPFSDGINTDYVTYNEVLSILYADLNEGRLPTYHRLDISVKRRFELGEHSNLEVDFSITNLYNRQNIFYVDRVSNERVDQLPIMPSLGISLTF